MDKDRKNKDNKAVRKHISAARDWLGRAESSMDRENSLRGDLDMMLAQAELQRARETKFGRGWRKWLVPLGPLFIALLVGLGYVAFLHSSRAVEPATDVPSDREREFSVAAPAKEQAVTTGPVVEENVTAADSGLEYRQEGTGGQELAGGEAVQQVQPPAGETESRSAPSMPDQELQQLMQAAGKVLRE